MQRLSLEQHIRQTQYSSYSATRQIWTWPVFHDKAPATSHSRQHARNTAFLWRDADSFRTGLYSQELKVLLPSMAGRRSHDLSSGLFWDKGLFIVSHAKPYPPLLYRRTFPGMTEKIAERGHERKKQLPGVQGQLEVNAFVKSQSGNWTEVWNAKEIAGAVWWANHNFHLRRSLRKIRQTPIRTEQVKGGHDPSELPSGFDWYPVLLSNSLNGTLAKTSWLSHRKSYWKQLPVLSYPVKEDNHSINVWELPAVRTTHSSSWRKMQQGTCCCSLLIFFLLPASDPQNYGVTLPLDCHPRKYLWCFCKRNIMIILECSHIKTKTKQLLLEH